MEDVMKLNDVLEQVFDDIADFYDVQDSLEVDDERTAVEYMHGHDAIAWVDDPYETIVGIDYLRYCVEISVIESKNKFLSIRRIIDRLDSVLGNRRDISYTIINPGYICIVDLV